MQVFLVLRSMKTCQERAAEEWRQDKQADGWSNRCWVFVLTRPKTRPALLRISSKLSAFFFWGMRLLPVLQHTQYNTIRTHTGEQSVGWQPTNAGELCLNRQRFCRRQVKFRHCYVDRWRLGWGGTRSPGTRVCLIELCIHPFLCNHSFVR